MNYLNLEEELNIKSKECYIFGKGISFDSFNQSNANKYRIAINHSVFFVKNCWAVFYYDYDLAELFTKRQNELKHIIVFKKCTHKTYSFNNEVLWYPKDLIITTQTSLIAVQVLYNLGFRRFNMIGFDSYDNNCRRSSKIMDFMEINNQELDRTKNYYLRDFVPCMKELVNILEGSEFIWHHRFV